MTTPGFSVHVDHLVPAHKAELATAGRHAMREAFDVLATELDEILDRFFRNDPHLVIIREPNYFVCEDVANDLVMFRNTDPLTIVKWARAFVLQTAGATLDERSVSAALGSGEVPTSVEVVTAPPDPQAAEAAAGEPATSLDQPPRHLRVVV